MDTPRVIAVVTSSRADYGHLYWALRAMLTRPALDVRLIVTGAHLSPQFGQTVGAIEADGLPIAERIECLMSADSDTAMARTLGVAVLSFTDVLSRMRPDLLLLIADRYEMLAPASVALTLRIPLVHIEGGESSEGAIDHAVRNALTMLSHVHLTTTERARERVIAMGEEPWRVHRVGAASLDHLEHATLLSRATLCTQLQLDADQRIVVVGLHPVTLDLDTTREARALLDALKTRSEQLVFCFPNADAGGRTLGEWARTFCAARPHASIHVNLERSVYWSLLRHADAMVGNSSSGIMESPSLCLPAVNVGRRQEGREQARNVISVKTEATAIRAALDRALSTEFRTELVGLENPYGDGQSGSRIAEHLASIPLGAKLLTKHTLPMPSALVP